MDLHSKGLDIVSAVSTTGKVGQVELDLVPSFVQPHGHCANKGLHSCCGLVVGGSKASSYVFVVEDLHFESEVFLQVLNDHDQEGELDPESLFRVRRAGNVTCANIR